MFYKATLTLLNNALGKNRLTIKTIRLVTFCNGNMTNLSSLRLLVQSQQHKHQKNV